MNSPQFVIFGFPVRIELFFFITMWLIAGGAGEAAVVAGVAVVAGASLLVHELGHAFAFRRFGGENISIRLLGFGGVTTCSGTNRFTPRQSLVISAAGVIAESLFVAVPAFVALRLLQPTGDFETILQYAVILNIIWVIFNLLPVLDLDGGHIVQHLARMATGRDQTTIIRYVSVVVALAVAGLGIKLGQPFAALFMAYLAYMNVQALIKDRKRHDQPPGPSSMPYSGPPTAPPMAPPTSPPSWTPPKSYPPIGRQD